MFCRQYLTALRESANDIEAAGAKVVAVMQGTAAESASLCGQYNVTFPCLADPTLDSYKTFGLPRGTNAQVLGPANWRQALRAMSKGHFGGKPIGDVMQLPGTFIVDGGGIVRYAKVATSASDHPSISELLGALRTMATDGS